MKPETPSDRKLATASRDARLTFIYTWTIADDDGLFRGEPRQLLGDLYPFDPDVTVETLEGWLAELVQIGAIRWRQTRDGARVGEIVNWAKHQYIRKRGTSFLLNELTAPPGHSTGPDGQNPPPDGALTEPDGKNPARSLESGVWSPESGVGSREGAARAALTDELSRTAFDNLCRASRNPEAWAAEVEALTTGLTPPAYPWAVVSQALREMSGNGMEPNLALLRSYCRKVTERRPDTTTVERSDGTLMLKSGGPRG